LSKQARLVGVLLDQLAAARDVSLALPSPRDPRARRFAELVTREPGDDASIAALARRAGASLGRSSAASCARPGWRSATGGAGCGCSTRCGCWRRARR
jgi:hypothetical protein